MTSANDPSILTEMIYREDSNGGWAWINTVKWVDPFSTASPYPTANVKPQERKVSDES